VHVKAAYHQILDEIAFFRLTPQGNIYSEWLTEKLERERERERNEWHLEMMCVKSFQIQSRDWEGGAGDCKHLSDVKCFQCLKKMFKFDVNLCLFSQTKLSM
jgi:hypothetical protein